MILRIKSLDSNTKIRNTRLYILGCKIGCLFCKTLISNVYCGERGIRTPGPVKVNSFQDCRNRPLCHLSSMSSPSVSRETGRRGTSHQTIPKGSAKIVKKLFMANIFSEIFSPLISYL